MAGAQHAGHQVEILGEHLIGRVDPLDLLEDEPPAMCKLAGPGGNESLRLGQMSEQESGVDHRGWSAGKRHGRDVMLHELQALIPAAACGREKCGRAVEA